MVMLRGGIIDIELRISGKGRATLKAILFKLADKLSKCAVSDNMAPTDPGARFLKIT